MKQHYELTKIVKAERDLSSTTLNIQIKTRGLELTEAIQTYIDKKFESLKKYFKDAPNDSHCLVEVGKTTQHHKKGDVFKADANINFFGQALYASAEKDDLYAAIDELKDEVAAELAKVKDKKISKMRKETLEAKAVIKGIQE